MVVKPEALQQPGSFNQPPKATLPFQQAAAAHLKAALQPARVVANAAGALQAVLRQEDLHAWGRWQVRRATSGAAGCVGMAQP